MPLLLGLALGGTLSPFGCDRPAAPLQPAPAVASPGAAALAAGPAAAPAHAVTSAASPRRFGAPLSDAAAIAAQAVLAEPSRFDDKDIKLTGTVSAACQRKGCWMTIGTGEPGQTTVRVSFKDYGFFVPTDCMGKRAIVEGHFKVTELSAAQAQHFADESVKPGAAPPQITKAQRTLALVATGVELLDS